MKNCVERVYVVVNSHIDPVWLWKRSEGLWVIRSTVRKIVELMEKRKDFTFAFSSAFFYKWVEEVEPSLFEKVRELVKAGKWVIVGGWWVEPDCNLLHGESFVRQALYGQLYFKEKLGVKVEVGYNIDSFGHNWMLPQILKKAGFKYYVFMRPKPHEKELPLDLFWWEAPDGSRVLAYRIPFSYVAYSERLKEHIVKSVEKFSGKLPVVLCLYGRGDHGGAPPEEDLELLEKLGEELGVEIKHSNIVDFFSDVLSRGIDFPVVRNELQHHARGCYSVKLDIKKLNRKVEHAMLAAERLAVMASLLAGGKYPKEDLQEAWQNLLFIQFHDSLDGTCIPEAYDDVKEMGYYALNVAKKVIEYSTHLMSSKINTVVDGVDKLLVVFNPLTSEVKYPIEIEPLWGDCTEIVDLDIGQAVPFQDIQPTSLAGTRRVVMIVSLPPLGYKAYGLRKGVKCEFRSSLKVSERVLENEYFVLKIDEESGCIRELIDKRYGVTVFRGLAAAPLVMKDESDTWSHGVDRFDEVVGAFELEDVKVVEKGPVRARIRVKSVYGRSRLWQDFILYSGLDFIEVRMRLEWFEKHEMLKLYFPVNVESPTLTCEIPYGVISRPFNGEEEPMLRWIDVTGYTASKEERVKYGVTILNDCLHSYDARGSEVRLTVVRNPVYAHHDPHKPEPHRDYLYTDYGIHKVRYIIFPHKDDWREYNIEALCEALNMHIPYVIEDKHEGKLPREFSSLIVKGEGVYVTVLKESEESRDLIVRIHEYTGRSREATLEIPAIGVTAKIHLKPYEIKTLRIDKLSKKVVESNLLEEI